MSSNEDELLFSIMDSDYNIYIEYGEYAADLLHSQMQLQQMETDTIDPLPERSQLVGSGESSVQTAVLQLREDSSNWSSSSFEKAKESDAEREAQETLTTRLQTTLEENVKLKELVEILRSESSTKISKVEEERDNANAALSSLRTKQTKISQDFVELQRVLVEHEALLKKLKSKQAKTKSTCLIYKNKCEKLTDETTELRRQIALGIKSAEPAEAKQLPTVTVKLVDYMKAAKKQAVETYLNSLTADRATLTDEEQEAVKQKANQIADQLTFSDAAIQNLKTENEAIKKSVVEKEDNFILVVKQARSRILLLTTLVEKYQNEAKQLKERLENIEKSLKDELLVQEAELRVEFGICLEEEVTKKNQALQELDQMKHRIEVLSSRVETLQKLQRVNNELMNDENIYVKGNLDHDVSKTQDEAERIPASNKKKEKKKVVTFANNPITVCCSMCNTSFPSKTKRRKHVCDYSARSNRCPYCPMSFRLQKDLNKHVMHHHPVKTYKCSLCNRSFSQKDHLARHQQTC